MLPRSRRLFSLQLQLSQAEMWLLQDRTSSKSGPMLRRSMAGPCASLACGATSAVMRLVASLLMSISSSSDTSCAASQMLGTIQVLRSQPRASWLLTCVQSALPLRSQSDHWCFPIPSDAAWHYHAPLECYQGNYAPCCLPVDVHQQLI